MRPDLGRLKEIEEDAFGGRTNLTSLLFLRPPPRSSGKSRGSPRDTLELGDRVSKLSIVTRGIWNVRLSCKAVQRASPGSASNGRPESAFFGEA